METPRRTIRTSTQAPTLSQRPSFEIESNESDGDDLPDPKVLRLKPTSSTSQTSPPLFSSFMIPQSSNPPQTSLPLSSTFMIPQSTNPAQTSPPLSSTLTIPVSTIPAQTSPLPSSTYLTLQSCTSPEPRSYVHAGTPTVTLHLPDRKCIICRERDCDSFVMTCGHTFCLVCALQVENMDGRCPTCRGNIDTVKSMFYN